MIHLWDRGLPKAPNSIPIYAPLILEVPSYLLSHMAQLAEQLAEQLDLLQNLLWDSLKTGSFSGHLVNGSK